MDFFDRFIEVTVEDKKFTSDESPIGLDIFFDVEIGNDENDAEVSIWNLKPETIRTLRSGQFVLINAGYKDSSGTLFTGKVDYIRTEREDSDIKTTLICTSEQFDVRETDTIIEAYAPEVVTAAIERVALANGLAIGHISTDATVINTGGICYDNLGDFLDWAATKLGADWFLLNSPLQVGATLYMIKPTDAISTSNKLIKVPYIIKDELDDEERRITVPLTWEVIPGSIINFTKGEDLKIVKIKHTSNKSEHTTELFITLTSGGEPGDIDSISSNTKIAQGVQLGFSS